MGFLDSLFGGGGDYGASGDLSNYQGTVGQEQGVAGGIGGIAGTEQNNLATLNPGYLGAIGNEASLLKQNPFTDNVSTAALSSATAGTTAAYTNAKAQISADMARRGLGAGSSMEAGGDVGAGNSLAATQSNALQNLAQQKIAREYGNASALTNLYGTAANTAEGQAAGALGEQGNILGGIGGQQLGLYQNAIGQQQQHAAGINQLVGSLAGVAGTIFGGPVGGAIAKQMFPGSNPYSSGPDPQGGA